METGGGARNSYSVSETASDCRIDIYALGVMDVGPTPSIRARCAAKQKPAPALKGDRDQKSEVRGIVGQAFLPAGVASGSARPTISEVSYQLFVSGNPITDN